jgi:methanethiol S-methyltransferase
MSEPYIPTRILVADDPPRRRVGVFVFSVAAYGAFLATFLYLIGFLAGVGVPKAIDDGPLLPWPAAAAINVGLLTLFALQHSVMARPRFKMTLLRLLPECAERSVYVAASNVALAVLFAAWSPMPDVLWNVDGVARVAGHVLFVAGVALVLYSTFLIDHFDLFGLRQGWLALRGREYVDRPFRVPGLYRFVRHPLYVGWIVVMWAAPAMSAGRLLFAVVTTAYILVATIFEERDLLRRFGRAYADYRARTPRIIPSRPRRPAPAVVRVATTEVLRTPPRSTPRAATERVSV